MFPKDGFFLLQAFCLFDRICCDSWVEPGVLGVRNSGVRSFEVGGWLHKVSFTWCVGRW
jgi:hypothetical protein